MGQLDVILGPLLIGTALNLVLYGLMLMQTHIYFLSNPNDPKWMKVFVIFLLIADTLNSAFDTAVVYDYLISNFGRLEAIEVASWIFNTDPFFTGLIASSVQYFFAWRVRRLTGKTWIGALIAFCSTVQFLSAIGTTIACTIVKEFVHFQKFQVIVILWLAFTALADVLITISLVWYLRKNKTGFATTDDILTRIVRMTVQTGMVTSVCALIDLGLFCGIPNNLHLIPNLPLCKLYTNSLLSTLNARSGWKFSPSSPYMKSHSQSKTRDGSGNGGIHVKTSETTHHDIELGVSPTISYPHPYASHPYGSGPPTTPINVSVKKSPATPDGFSMHSSDDGYEKKASSLGVGIGADGARRV